jgi:hypothetical protein
MKDCEAGEHTQRQEANGGERPSKRNRYNSAEPVEEQPSPKYEKQDGGGVAFHFLETLPRMA